MAPRWWFWPVCWHWGKYFLFSPLKIVADLFRLRTLVRNCDFEIWWALLPVTKVVISYFPQRLSKASIKFRDLRKSNSLSLRLQSHVIVQGHFYMKLVISLWLSIGFWVGLHANYFSGEDKLLYRLHIIAFLMYSVLIFLVVTHLAPWNTR